MDPATVVVILLVAAATLGILWLPMRKRWNDDGADDARRQAVERETPARVRPHAASGARPEGPRHDATDGARKGDAIGPDDDNPVDAQVRP